MLTIEAGVDYLFRLKDGKQPKLTAEARRLLGASSHDEAMAVDEERYRGHMLRRSVYIAEDTGIWPNWTGARALLRVRCDKLDDQGQMLHTEDRYYVTSLSLGALTGRQWIRVTRGHWAVENNCHHTWDAVLREDQRPWIVAAPKATLTVMMLRRITYNILTLFRSVTLRSSKARCTPWRDLLRWLHIALVSARSCHVEGLRQRKLPIDKLA